MRCPTLNDLPAPPPGKTGWPWTEESPQLSDKMEDGSEWPRISIVTPSFNQGQFIEETIRSVLLQGYPNLEYLVIDGGSSDETVRILKKYESYLDHWVSEPDRGQSEAINKGWHRATGDILAWLNSDDWLQCQSLTWVGAEFSKLPTESGGITGSCLWHRDGDTSLRTAGMRFDSWQGRQVSCDQQQPSTFVKREALARVGYLDPRFRYVMDKDLWLRLQIAGLDLTLVPKALSNFRCHSVSKTTGDREYPNVVAAREYFWMRRRLWGSPLNRTFWLRAGHTLAILARRYKLMADATWEKRSGINRYSASLYYNFLAYSADPRLLWLERVSRRRQATDSSK